MLDKKALEEFDRLHEVYVAQLPLPGIGEPVPEESWARLRATKRFIKATASQTTFNDEIARLAKRRRS